MSDMLRDFQPHDGEKTALDPRVAALLSAASAPSEPGKLPGEEEALAAFRADRGAPAHLAQRRSLRAAAAAAVGAALILTGGVAAAVTGSLPGAAQDTARVWFDQVGVDVPGSGLPVAATTDERGEDGDGEGGDAGGGDRAAMDVERPEQAQHGATVSETARETEATGADKGAVVSEEASQGRSRAGDEHPAGAAADGDEADRPHGTVSEDGETHARVEVPNHGAAAEDEPGDEDPQD